LLIAFIRELFINYIYCTQPNSRMRMAEMVSLIASQKFLSTYFAIDYPPTVLQLETILSVIPAGSLAK